LLSKDIDAVVTYAPYGVRLYYF